MKSMKSIISIKSIALSRIPVTLQAGIHPPSAPPTLPVLSEYRPDGTEKLITNNERIPSRLGAWLSRPRQQSRARCPKTVEKIPQHSTKQLRTKN